MEAPCFRSEGEGRRVKTPNDEDCLAAAVDRYVVVFEYLQTLSTSGRHVFADVLEETCLATAPKLSPHLQSCRQSLSSTTMMNVACTLIRINPHTGQPDDSVSEEGDYT